MPSDAAALIAQLREHPRACGMLRVCVAVVFGRDVVRFRDLTLMSDATPEDSDHFAMGVCAITGASQKKCDELGIEIVRYADGFGTIERQNVVATTGDIGHRMVIGKKHETRLAAALAALERHDA